jgi:hypothetical protein
MSKTPVGVIFSSAWRQIFALWRISSMRCRYRSYTSPPARIGTSKSSVSYQIGERRRTS